MRTRKSVRVDLKIIWCLVMQWHRIIVVSATLFIKYSAMGFAVYFINFMKKVRMKAANISNFT